MLKESELSDKKVISVFDSANKNYRHKEGQLSTDLIVVQTFFF